MVHWRAHQQERLRRVFTWFCELFKISLEYMVDITDGPDCGIMARKDQG